MKKSKTLDYYVSKIDWCALESDLVLCFQRSILVIKDNNLKDIFGYALDVNITYGDLFIAVGNRSDLPPILNESIGGSQTNSLFSYKHIEDIWSIGDWKYPRINDYFEDVFERKWRKWGDLISFILYDEICEQDADFELEKAFKETVLDKLTNILIEFYKNGYFSCIDKYKYFEILVIEHDELIEEGIKRMRRLKTES